MSTYLTLQIKYELLSYELEKLLENIDPEILEHDYLQYILLDKNLLQEIKTIRYQMRQIKSSHNYIIGESIYG